jgi:hypothetical protein
MRHNKSMEADSSDAPSCHSDCLLCRVRVNARVYRSVDRTLHL